MYQQNQSIIYPLPTDALLFEREVVWRVKLPDDYKEFIKKENGVIPSKRYFHFEHNEKVIDNTNQIFTRNLDEPSSSFWESETDSEY